MNNFTNQIDDIMHRFNFAKVLIAMHALNWTWLGEEVTVKKLQSTAMELLDTVVREYERDPNGWKTVATGGFQARIDIFNDQPLLSLAFLIEHKEAHYA